MLANSGHFDVEIDKAAPRELGTGGVRRIREFVDEYTFADGRRSTCLGEGRLVNLSAAEGPSRRRHGHVVREPGARGRVGRGEPRARSSRASIRCPSEIDKEVARLKLHAMGVEIDELTAEQEHYLHSWEQGT